MYKHMIFCIISSVPDWNTRNKNETLNLFRIVQNVLRVGACTSEGLPDLERGHLHESFASDNARVLAEIDVLMKTFAETNQV